MTILGSLLIMYLLVVLFFYLFQSSFLFFPQGISYQVPVNEDIEEVVIPVSEGRNLHGWFSKQSNTEKHKLIIYFGGNAEEVSHLISATHFIGDYSLLLINYPGYGKSDGRPGEKSFFEAGLAIYDYAISRNDIRHDKISVMGRSIGTGTATYLASKRAVDKVILISPFESIRAVAQSKMPFLPINLLLKHRFDSKKYAQQISSPTLIFYGTNDNIIPPKHTKELAGYWKGAVKTNVLEGYNHNNIFESPEMWTEINTFLKD